MTQEEEGSGGGRGRGDEDGRVVGAEGRPRASVAGAEGRSGAWEGARGEGVRRAAMRAAMEAAKSVSGSALGSAEVVGDGSFEGGEGSLSGGVVVGGRFVDVVVSSPGRGLGSESCP